MRERDVRTAIQTALLATNAFSGVWLTGLPEDYGQASSDFTAAVIEPMSTSLTTGWDAQLAGGIEYTSQLAVTVLARHPDAQLRDELAEQLLEWLKNAADGQSLAGFTLPGLTRVNAWRWEKATPPERRITATLSFAYLETWEDGDTST